MALEPNFRYLDDLVPANPGADDPVAQGDDHLRGIKSSLTANVTGDAGITRLKVAGENALTVQDKVVDSLAQLDGDHIYRAQGPTYEVGRLTFADAGPTILASKRPGQGVSLTGRAADDLSDVTLLTGEPGGAVALNHAGLPSIVTDSQGAIFQRGAGSSTVMLFRTETGVTEAHILSQGAGPVQGKAYNPGRGWAFVGRNGGDTDDHTLFDALPDGASAMYHNNVKAIETNDLGATVYRDGDTATPYIFLSNNLDVVATLRANYSGNFVLAHNNPIRGVEMRTGGTSGSLLCRGNAGADFELYWGGSDVVRTRQFNGSYNTSGAQVRDYAGGWRDVGFNTMSISSENGNYTLTERDVGRMMRKGSGGVNTYTLPSGSSGAVPPVSAVVMAINLTSAAITLAAEGTLRWFTGSGVALTGNRTLGQGGVCTLYKYSSTEWYVWGNGLS